MSHVPTSGGGAAAYYAMVANAIKACGTIVRVEPEVFLEILARQDCPLVVRATGGIFSTSYRYLTSYKGLAFFCKSSQELNLPNTAEMISARKISVPDI